MYLPICQVSLNADSLWSSSGGVLSPPLYNHFTSDLPEEADLTESHADDFEVAESDPDIVTLSSALTNDLVHVSSWAAAKNLKIAPTKSSVTLFTPDRHQSHAHSQVYLDEELIPLCRTPKILGVTFDPHLTFCEHINAIILRAAGRLQILKALAGTSWGQQKETLLITFKCLILSIINYAAPIWFPNASKLSIEKIQIIQNAALRIVTGCHKKYPINHLHQNAQGRPPP
jgi:hypothetical protein